MALTPDQIKELDLASARISAGKAGAASDGNAGDIANVEFAKRRYGYTYNPVSNNNPTVGGDTNAPPTTKLTRYNITPTESEANKAQRTYYEGLDKEVTADEEAAIKNKVRQDMQYQIDAINSYYADLLGQAEQAGVGRLGQTRAINSRAGLLGSDMGAANKSNTESNNLAVEKSIKAEQSMKIAAVWDKIDERADSLVTAEKNKAIQNAKDYIDYLKTKQGEAKDDVKTLAQSGLSLDEVSEEDYKKLLDQTGMNSFMMEAYYNANKPTSSKVDYQYKIEGNQLVAYGVDPKTGKLKYVAQQLPDTFKTEEYSGFTVTPDGTPLFYNAKTGKATIAEGFKEGQFIKPTTTKGKAPTVDTNDVLGELNDWVNKLNTKGATFEEVPEDYKTFITVGTKQIQDPTTGKPTTINTYKMNEPTAAQLKELAKNRSTGNEEGDDVILQVKEAFNNVVGSDGKVSPDNWNLVKQTWIENGGTAEEFENQFSNYKNPQNQYYQ